MGFQPKARAPEKEHGHGEYLNDEERGGINRPEGERAEDENSQHEGEDSALAPAIQNFAIHQSGKPAPGFRNRSREVLARVGNFARKSAGGYRCR